MSNSNKIFAKGINFKRQSTAPSWVIGQQSFKVSEAVEFLQANQNQAGYVNVDIKVNKDGKYYIELNQYDQLYAQGVGTPKNT